MPAPDTDALMRLILDRIQGLVRPSTVLLFGSRARGDHGPDADVDLLIVMPAPVADPWRLAADLRRAIGAIGVGVDIIISDEAHFVERSHLVGSIEGIAAREGRRYAPHAA